VVPVVVVVIDEIVLDVVAIREVGRCIIPMEKVPQGTLPG